MSDLPVCLAGLVLKSPAELPPETLLPRNFNFVDGPFTAATAQLWPPSAYPLSDEKREEERVHLMRWSEGCRRQFASKNAPAIVATSRRITEVPDASAFRTLSRAEQLDALASASMDVLHALLEAPADLACARDRATLLRADQQGVARARPL